MDRLITAERFRNTKSTKDMFDVFANIAGNFGISGFLYLAVASRCDFELNGAANSGFIQSNYPAEYLNSAPDNAFLDDDLTVDVIVSSGQIMRWDDESLWDNATPEQIKQSEIDRDYGLEVGLSIPITYESSVFLSGFGLATQDLTSKELDHMWKHNSSDILFLCSLVDNCIAGSSNSCLVGLSPREQEALEWLAIGLRPDQIAFKMGIGYRTIDKHINRAKYKLKAKTRDQAIARALSLNVISP